MPKANSSSPLPERVDALIIGAGFGGVAMGRQLKRAGVDNFVMLERADRPGGVWRDNRYPGAACDVPSHLYSYSFFLNPGWSRKFSPQAEILDYLERAIEAFGLAAHLHYRRTVKSLSYEEATGCWRVTLENGQTVSARTVISAVGQLSEPLIPGIEGLETFQGPVLHSAAWDEHVDFAGKRVAVIGNAASAVQILPEIAEKSSHVTVFQRTPNWVIGKPDRAFTPLEKWLFRRLPGWNRLYRAVSYLMHEARFPAFLSGSWINAYMRWSMTRRITRQVADPELRAALTPDYAPGCKRILLADDYFETLQRPDVDLIAAAPARVEAGAVIGADGTQVRVDAIILATGFKANVFLAGLDVTGRGGRKLHEVWGESAHAYKGVATHGFPNLFMLYGPNTNLGHNSIIFMLERQSEFVRRQIVRLLDEDLRMIEVDKEAEAAWNRALQTRLERTVWAGECPSWYKSPDGVIANNWSGLASAFALSLAGRDDQAFHVER